MPPTMIAGPTLEALRYTYDEDELREMYENLLASSMDNRIAIQAYPAFVDAIKQIYPLDAVIFNRILELGSRLRCAEITFRIKDTTQVYTKGMPTYFVSELVELGDTFLVSSILVNIERLGLIKITESGLLGGDYDGMKKIHML